MSDRYKMIRETIPPVGDGKLRQTRRQARYIKGLKRKYDNYPNQLSPKELLIMKRFVGDIKPDEMLGDMDGDQ